MPTAIHSVPDALVGFVRALRDEGLAVGPAVAADLLEALEAVGADRGEDVYWAFRALTISRHDQVALFDRVFMAYFGSDQTSLVGHLGEVLRTWSVRGGGLGDDGEPEAPDTTMVTGASSRERLAGRDFATLSSDEETEVKKLIAQMLWQPPRVRSRRYQPSSAGRRPDMRRTLRRAVGVEGDMLRIATTVRIRRRRPLILLLDISGSMDRYSEMLLYFAHAARARLGRLEAFVFGTRLTRITPQLALRRPGEAIERVAGTVVDWSGGTLIGQSLREFNLDWLRRVGRGGPVVLIVSDGWDRGDPGLLAVEMDRLHRSVHQVVWLNPLSGRPGYQPETRGMKAALPHVDDFLPAASLSDLETLIYLLESISPTYA